MRLAVVAEGGGGGNVDSTLNQLAGRSVSTIWRSEVGH